MKPTLSGIIPPMITPLDDEERLDRAALARVVAYQLGRGVHGRFISGTAGEGPALLPETRQALIRATLDEVGGRVPVLVGCMAPGAQQSLALIRALEGLNVAAAVVTPPFYYGTANPEVVLAHYRYLAEHAPLPIMAYNIPGMTHSPLTPETIAAIAEIPNIIGVKDSRGDTAHLRRVLELRPQGFMVLQGSEVGPVEDVLAGIDGFVPASGNIAPHWMAALWEAARAGRLDEARALEQQVAAYRKGVYTGGVYWLAGLKGAASLLGLCGPRCARPILPLTDAQRRQISAALDRLGLL